MNAQSYAIQIEHELSRIFDCERYGFGGLVNSDLIRKNPFYSMFCGLAYLSSNTDSKNRAKIENFIEETIFYSNFSIDQLLEFKNKTKTIDGVSIDIGYDNGELAITDLIEKFSKVCE